MNDQANPVSRPWRRFLRFSVRVLMVAVLLFGGLFGWVVRSARIQREAVSAIRRAGNSVEYDWEWINGKRAPGGKPWAPERLVDLVGMDYFGKVHYVVIWDTWPDTIAAVARLSGLRRLGINGRALRDADLAPLEDLTELSELVIGGSPVSAAGLGRVSRLTRLRKLVLVNSDVTDLGILQLKSLTNLRVLKLGNMNVTDAWVKELRQSLPNVEIDR